MLEAGAKIYEYEPSMIHAKILIIDGVWSVVGSTNFDSRSFGINDEVNMAVLDPMLAARLTQDFWKDCQRKQGDHLRAMEAPASHRARERVVLRRVARTSAIA